MKTLTKVKLINWHTFINEEFKVYHNTLMTGENATGKSTILDAMQYVLTCGKCKFNKAASDIGNRTLESYIRCKIGKEGHEYLRNGDVSCYIALEFYDEKTLQYQIIGVAFDLYAGSSRPVRDFFQITNTLIKDVTFIENNKVFTRKQFKKRLSDNAKNTVFKDNIRDAQRLFSNALGVKEKYFDLVTRALAFKAIDNVYQFIMDFLLKEDFVDINNLRQSIHHYQQLEERLKLSKKECDDLQIIKQHYNEYQEVLFQIKTMDFVNTKFIEKQLSHQITKSHELLEKSKLNLNNLNEKLSRFENNDELYRKRFNELENSLDQNDSYRLRKSLLNDRDNLNKEKNRMHDQYTSLIDLIKKETDLLSKLNTQKDFIKYVNNNQFDTENLRNYFNEIEKFVKNSQEKLKDEIKKTKSSIETNMNDYNKKIDTYNLLKNNQHSYRKEVQGLIDLLKEKLFYHYGKQIEVKPLCEYIEIKDESWRNSIEGYLNSQRFDIIIDPEYFEYSLLIYEEYKNRKGIYGVGIVDVAKLKKYENIPIEGTLAQQLEFKNTYAKWYVNMILGKVYCVDDVRQLRNYHIAITRTAMLYKNYTVRALNPNIYKTPFIGLKSIDIQKKSLQIQMDQLKKQIDEEKTYYNKQNSILKMVSESKVNQIMPRIWIIDDYQLINLQINNIDKQLNNLELDDSIFTLQEEYDRTKEQLIEIKSQKMSITEEIGKTKGKIEDIAKELEINNENNKLIHEQIIQYEIDNIDICQEADHVVLDYEKQYYKNYQHIFKLIKDKISNDKNTMNKLINQIVIQMNDYNKEYNIGFENDINDIERYTNRYYQLRDMDIVDKTEKARQAKMKCEESFKTSFISGLNEKIENAKRDINVLNKGLSQRNFNGETYEFCVNPTKKDNFKEYYKIIQTGNDYLSENLLSETLDEGQRRIMDELFVKLSTVDNNKETEKMLMEYTDYRNYLDYDIKIKYDDGTYSYFSKVNKEKSGGETQTPFYVIMAASFEQVIKNKNQNEDFGCVVIFDEAFNNMDEYRIQEMIKFYNEREIQTFIVVPPSRSSTIIPYVNTRLLVIKQNNNSFVEVITDEKV